ncbi:MAG: SDR family oxidoreductase, partial [Dehalococcoidia bacterium]
MAEWKHALVTGGNSGIGRAIALAFAEEGINVTICGRRADKLAEVAAESDRIHAVPADVTDEKSVTQLYEKAEAARGPFDVVVANAGIASSAPAHRTSLEEWNRIIGVNLTGAFLTARPALKGMADRKSGRIIFIASVAGLRGSAYVAPYVASKHGVVGLTRALAAELLMTGVTVNAICPAYVETEMLEESIARVMEKTGRGEAEAREGFAAFNPNHRLIKPEEVAAAVLW